VTQSEPLQDFVRGRLEPGIAKQIGAVNGPVLAGVHDHGCRLGNRVPIQVHGARQAGDLTGTGLHRRQNRPHIAGGDDEALVFRLDEVDARIAADQFQSLASADLLPIGNDVERGLRGNRAGGGIGNVTKFRAEVVVIGRDAVHLVGDRSRLEDRVIDDGKTEMIFRSVGAVDDRSHATLDRT
jgi:hypothetical protein